jgi:hypothetical protein
MKRTFRLLAFWTLLLLLPALPFSSAAQTDEDAEKPAPALKTGVPFPFRVLETDSEYDLYIDLKEPAVKQKYRDIFLKYKLPYTPAAFEEALLQIAERDPGLARIMITATEEGRVLVGTGNPIYRQNLINLLQPMLQQPERLGQILKDMDREGLEEDEEEE